MKHKEMLEQLRAGGSHAEFNECGLPWSLERAQKDRTWALWQGRQLQMLLGVLPNSTQLEQLCQELIAHRVHDQ